MSIYEIGRWPVRGLHRAMAVKWIVGLVVSLTAPVARADALDLAISVGVTRLSGGHGGDGGDSAYQLTSADSGLFVRIELGGAFPVGDGIAIIVRGTGALGAAGTGASNGFYQAGAQLGAEARLGAHAFANVAAGGELMLSSQGQFTGIDATIQVGDQRGVLRIGLAVTATLLDFTGDRFSAPTRLDFGLLVGARF